MDTNNHIILLDAFAGSKLEEIKLEYQKLYEKYQEIKSKLKENYGDDKEKQRRLNRERFKRIFTSRM